MAHAGSSARFRLDCLQGRRNIDVESMGDLFFLGDDRVLKILSVFLNIRFHACISVLTVRSGSRERESMGAMTRDTEFHRW